MGPLLSTRLASSALPMTDGARCFYAYYLCGELVKTARADAMISVNQLVNQYSCLVSSLSPSLVSLSGAGRLLLALRCLISDRFCIIPVGSGIEHFFRNNAAVLRFPTCLPIGVSVLASLSLGTAFPAARAVSARVMSSISAGCLLAYRVMSSLSSFASPFPGSPLVVSSSRPVSSCRGTGSRRGCLLAS